MILNDHTHSPQNPSRSSALIFKNNSTFLKTQPNTPLKKCMYTPQSDVKTNKKNYSNPYWPERRHTKYINRNNRYNRTKLRISSCLVQIPFPFICEHWQQRAVQYSRNDREPRSLSRQNMLSRPTCAHVCEYDRHLDIADNRRLYACAYVCVGALRYVFVCARV